MNVDLFLKKVPSVVKDLIGREAMENRRSVNQEAIALLEEALLNRVGTQRLHTRSALVETLRTYADGKNVELSRTVNASSAVTASLDTH